MEKIKNFELFCEALLRQSTKNQLDSVQKQIKKELGGDAGDKTPTQHGPGAAYKPDYFKAATDKNLDTYEDYMKEPFKVNQNIKKVSEATTFKDVERFLHKSYQENPTDDDAELAERALMHGAFQDAEDQLEDWAFDIAAEILGGSFY